MIDQQHMCDETITTIINRLNYLESQNRRLSRFNQTTRLIFIVVGLLIIGFALLGSSNLSSEVQDVIKTNRLEIVDDSGNIKIAMGCIPEDPNAESELQQPCNVGEGFIKIYNKEDFEVVSISNSIYPSISLTDPYSSECRIYSNHFAIYSCEYNAYGESQNLQERIFVLAQNDHEFMVMKDEHGNELWYAE